MMKSYLLPLLCLLYFPAASQLVINELSQGPSGTKEYVELVVTGNVTCGGNNTVDLRGWILDDNNSWHASGSGTGIATGHVKFDSIPQWANIKIGSIILVYNDADVSPATAALSPDETDANSDCVYIVPISSPSLLKNNTLPTAGGTMTTYAVAGTTYTTTGTWNPLGMANGGDAFHTVSPADYSTSYFAIGWGNNTQQLTVYFSAGQGGMVIYNGNGTDNDPFNSANYVNASANTNETPGAPNNPANAAWLASMNNNCQPFTQPTTTRNLTICPGQSIVIGSTTVTSPGTYLDTIPALVGCDTVRSNIVAFSSLIPDTQAVNLCPGNSVTINGQQVSNAGNYNDTIPSIAGCDTVRTFVVSVLPYNTSTVPVSLCPGASTVINGQTITAAGTYLDTVTGPACDTIISYNVSLLPYNTKTIPLSICSGQSIVINGQTVSTTGNYLDTVPGPACDTIITYQLSVGSYITGMQSISLCPGGSVVINGSTITTSGTYLDTISGGANCDTIRTYNVTVNPYNTKAFSAGICPGSSVSVNGVTYSAAGAYVDTIPSLNGCDTIVTVQIVQFSNSGSTQNVSICQGQTYFAGGAQQTTSGVYTDTLTSSNGCDSVVTTNLQVNNASSSSQNISVCSGTSYNGVLVVSDTTLTMTLTNQFGCDSVVTANISAVTPPQISIDGDTLIQEGASATLTASGATTYNWNNSISTASITVAPSATTAYYVTGSDGNCSAYDSVTVYVLPEDLEILIPTAFSPNGDGVNDYFDVVNRSLFNITTFHIYNRWGELVFSDASTHWDGMFKGFEQPVGTFVFYVEATSLASGKKYSLKGNVTLLR